MGNGKKHLFLLAGEHSGDLHGSHLIKAIQSQSMDYYFSGVAGPLMRETGIETTMPMEHFTVMGYTDVIKALPSLFKKFYILRDHILRTQPEGVIFIDYPGLNIRLAKALRKAGYKGRLIHYICPSVWAWGKKRIGQMSDTLDLLLTIYPFESASFSHTPLKVEYIGNPLFEYISQHNYEENWKKHFPLIRPGSSLIALFPGSRKGEIQRNLPKQLQAAVLFQEKYPDAVFGISCSRSDLKSFIDLKIQETGLKHAFIVPKNYTYELMRDSHSAIAKSGTVTLELALHKRPTVVVYELTKLNWLIAKYLIRLRMPHYCIVNILSNKRVFPELIEKGFTRENLALQLENIHLGPTRQECLNGCEKTIELFQQGKASLNAARAVQGLFA